MTSYADLVLAVLSAIVVVGSLWFLHSAHPHTPHGRWPV